MYKLPLFTTDDKEEILRFRKDYPFIFLRGSDEENKPVVTQVPVPVDGKDGKYFFTGQVLRNTDHHRAFLQHPSELAVVNGLQTFISTTWYTDPHQASTWNYVSVHARGNILFGDARKTAFKMLGWKEKVFHP